MRLREEDESDRRQKHERRAVVSDDGPGIPNIDEALQVGFTSGAGLGMGLPGARRLMDDMEIDSALGRGTTVTIRKWRR